MIIKFSLYDYQNGKIFATCSGPESDANLNGDWIEGHWDGREYYVLNGEPTERPVIDAPAFISLDVSAEWEVGDVPAGTTVLIDRVEVGVTDGTALILSFPVAKTYRVDLRPPFPWRDCRAEVEVHEVDT